MTRKSRIWSNTLSRSKSLKAVSFGCADLQPPDVHLPEIQHLKSALNGSKTLAITLGTDDEARALADDIEVEILLDKLNLTDELIPAILALHRTSG